MYTDEDYINNAEESEAAFLGCLIHDNTLLDEIASLISFSDFSNDFHKVIYKTISDMVLAGKPADLISLNQALCEKMPHKKDRILLEIAEILRGHWVTSSINHYASIIKSYSNDRKLLEAAQEMISDVHEAKEHRFDIAQQRLSAISDKSPKIAIRASEILPATVALLEERRLNKGALRGVSSGLNNLDEMTQGLQNGELIILAARPSMGKSTLCMNIAEHISIKKGLPVLFFSLEMPRESLIERTISNLSEINFTHIRSGNITEEDCIKISDIMPNVDAADLFIDDRSSVSVSEMRSECRRIKREHGLALVVVDYLQLMKVPGHKENRTNEISEISRSLKSLARDLNIPVLALSQLNRTLEQRPDKRPVMSDLRDSGAIEQDADLILFIYRDEVYNSDTIHKGYAELNIAKQRNGPLGTVFLKFQGEYCRFTEYAGQLPTLKPHKSVKPQFLY